LGFPSALSALVLLFSSTTAKVMSQSLAFLSSAAPNPIIAHENLRALAPAQVGIVAAPSPAGSPHVFATAAAAAAGVTAALVGRARQRRWRALRATFLVARRAEEKGMLRTVYDRVRGKDKIEALEGQIAQVNKLMAEVAERADNLQTSMEKELKEERNTMKEIKHHMSELQKSYETLIDDMELEQTQSAEKLQDVKECLIQANMQLRLKREKETELVGRLSKAELDRARRAKQLEALIQQLAEAHHVVSELVAREQENQKLIMEVASMEATNKKLVEDTQQLLGELQASGTTADNLKNLLLGKEDANKKLVPEIDSIKTESDKQDKELRAFLMQQTEQTNAIKAYDAHTGKMMVKAAELEKKQKKAVPGTHRQLGPGDEAARHGGEDVEVVVRKSGRKAGKAGHQQDNHLESDGEGQGAGQGERLPSVRRA